MQPDKQMPNGVDHTRAERSPDGMPVPDARPEYLREACEASLRRLRLDTIPLYQLHNPDPDVPIKESMGALEELRKGPPSGKKAQAQ